MKENFSNDVDFNLDFNNVDPSTLQTDDTINVVFVLDKSPSMNTPLPGSTQSRMDALNEGLNDFIQTMQKSHIADRLLVSTVVFDTDVEVLSGYQPIINIKPYNIHPNRSMTALYKACLLGINNAVKYRKNLEDSGITTKTLVFIITDGEDNQSPADAPKVKFLLEQINRDEKNVFSFTVILFGVGENSEIENSREAMGIDKNLVAPPATTGAEFRKMINWISSSVSSAASNQNIPQF